MIKLLNYIANTFLSPEKIVFLAIFFCNSFLGWLLCTIQIVFQKKKRSENLIFWSVLSIVFVSLYNATKIPENDLGMYVDLFLRAGYYNLWGYLDQLTGGKEPLYQMIVYFLHLIGGRNSCFFIFSISLISYAFLLRALIVWKNHLNVPETNFMLAVMTLCFFPWTFALSVHIIRQFLALSIFLWAFFSYYGKDKKIYWLYAFCSVFVHSSVVIFIPLLFIKKIASPIKIKYLYVIAGVVAIFSSIKQLGLIALNYVRSSNTLAHIAQKAADGTHFETTLPLSQLLFSVGLVVLGFIGVYVKKKSLKNSTLVALFLNTSLILLCFILASSHYSEIQLRYNFYFWSFIPFFVLLYVSSIDLKGVFKFAGMFLLFVAWNIYNISLSQWTYTCSYDYFFYPFLYYFWN